MAHAVVIGGSLAGLLAARILSDHFEQVTIIERDQYPASAEFRNGVPQARHLHILLAKGHDILAEYFPTLDDDFARLGIPSIELGWATTGYTAGGWTRRVHSGVMSNPVTRVTIDWYVRQQLQQRPNIAFLTQMEAEGLTTDEAKQIITGVVATSRADQSTQTIHADLVVDASGRLSKAPQWLQSLGYGAPSQTIVNSYLGYATRWYEMPPNRTFDWHILLITGLPAEGYFGGAAIQVVEGNQWVVTVAGVNKNYPPTDDEGFLEFAHKLASPAIYEAIKDAKPISPIYGYRRTENVWNHYEQLTRHPARLLVMGDAYCGFNPIYGQGMSVAAMEAQTLDRLLHQYGRDGLQPAGFYRALAKVIRDPWLLATGEDLRYPGTEGDRPGLMARLIQKYVDRLIAVLPLDGAIMIAFTKVNNLVAPPAILFAPSIVGRVLWYTLRGVQRDETLNMPVVRPEPTGAD